MEIDDKFVKKEKGVMTRLITRCLTEQIAWSLLQWWDGEDGHDPDLTPEEVKRLDAVALHARVLLLKQGAARRRLIQAWLYRIGLADPDQGGIFCREMQLVDRLRRTESIIRTFSLDL